MSTFFFLTKQCKYWPWTDSIKAYNNAPKYNKIKTNILPFLTVEIADWQKSYYKDRLCSFSGVFHERSLLIKISRNGWEHLKKLQKLPCDKMRLVGKKCNYLLIENLKTNKQTRQNITLVNFMYPGAKRISFI